MRAYDQLQKKQQLVDDLSWRKAQSRTERRENAVKKRDWWIEKKTEQSVITFKKKIGPLRPDENRVQQGKEISAKLAFEIQWQQKKEWRREVWNSKNEQIPERLKWAALESHLGSFSRGASSDERFLWKQVQQCSYKIYVIHINWWFNSTWQLWSPLCHWRRFILGSRKFESTWLPDMKVICYRYKRGGDTSLPRNFFNTSDDGWHNISRGRINYVIFGLIENFNVKHKSGFI